MPEKKNTGTSYETIMRDLKARHFSPIYILMGDESYYIDKISDYIAEHVLRPEERDFNQTVVFGSDISASQIVDSAKAFPMMAEKRVVIVKEAQNLKGTEPLVKYFKQPVVSTVLVLCHKNGSIDKRKKIIPAAQVGGAVIFESKKLYERELPGFITSYFMQHEITIEQKAAQMIADHVGADLHRLTSELDKILISFSEVDRMVTPEIVEKEIGVSKDFNAFELRSAIIQRDVYKANLITKYFDNNPKAGSLFSFLPMLFSYFENLMIAFYSPNRSNENALVQFLELRNGWAAKDYLTGLRNYSGMKTMQIISKIREIDAKSKGLDNPNTASSELMKELIFFILH
ncbi:DNA polymerase III subunit delta [Segatella maculosa]|uniref:DNA polymerase III, delta subunit n=1 Tax=Segatella maculosa OT 289 TaxID=999422 RepID=H1HJ23_9BACT|nr:DNA polymerase III subunit delta [Segatella maculosa]EHO74416.1 DNA polymerase III, delta subunit [Segatella maculosa OT 289]